MGVAARTEEASGDAPCGVRRANDGKPCGLPRPRSPPIRESFARSKCHARSVGLLRGKRHRFVFASPRRSGPIRSRGAER